MKKILFCLLVITAGSIAAGELDGLNSFTANTPAVAAQVNANFIAVKVEVDDNDNRIDDLIIAVMTLQTELSAAQSTISQLESELMVVQSNSVLSLDGYLSLETVNGYDTAEFSAVNVMVNNGTGTTRGEVDGLGNLIVGYNKYHDNSIYFCDYPGYDDVFTCNDNGGVWQKYITTGSHNLIVGSGHSYTSYGSFVAGRYNVIQGKHSSVSGGVRNIASGDISSVSGGSTNSTPGYISSVSGGNGNAASGGSSTVSGGRYNIASDSYSSVSGGRNNIASSSYSSVSGGLDNIASSLFSSVSGGRDNLASALYSSVSGGRFNTASGENSSVSGGNLNTASGENSSVSGGFFGTAADIYDWVAGTLLEDG